MAAVVSSVGLALMHAHSQRAVFLWIVVLITAITADSPVSEEPHLDSTFNFMKNPTSTGPSLSALPASHFTTFGDSPTTPASPEPTHETRTTDITQREEKKTSSPREEYFSSSVLSPSKPVLSSDLQPAMTNASNDTAHIPSQQPQSNTTPQHEPSTQSLATMSSFPGQSLEPSKVAFSDYQADQVIPYPDIVTSSNTLGTNQLSPSIVHLNTPDPNTILNPYEALAPSYNVPFVSPHPTSPSSEPTESPLDDIFPSDTMDIDWGSGDYLETISYMGSNVDDYSLVTKVPTEMFDMEENTESYDTSFPSRVGISPSSMLPFHVFHSPSLTAAHSTNIPMTYLSTHSTIEPTPSLSLHNDIAESSNVDWSDHLTIEPTDVLLPDMNSLEYYTTQKENSDSEAEQRGNVTVVSVSATDITPTISFDNDTKLPEEESSSDMSGSGLALETTEQTPHMVSENILDPSKTTDLFLSSSMWSSGVVTSATAELDSSVVTNATVSLPDDVIAYSSLTDVHWFVTEPFVQTTVQPTPVLTATLAFTSVSTEMSLNSTTFTTATPQNATFNGTLNVNTTTPASTSNVTSVMVGDQGTTEDGVDIPVTMTLLPESTEADTDSTTALTTTVSITPHQATPKMTTVTKVSKDVSISHTITPLRTTQLPRQYLCDIDKSEYLVKISFPSGATIGYAKSQVRDILKAEFNKSVELQVVEPPPKFVFRVVSGPVVYTALSIINTLQRSGRRFMSVSPNWTTPDHKYQVHTVLQFVPNHIDVRFCNFSESIERGLTRAYAEVCRRSKESTNFTVQIVNITKAAPITLEQIVRQPVDIIFTVRSSGGHLMGSEVSDALMRLTMVEFSYYMGFPVLQIAEPFHYPELNTSQLLRSSWVKTILLGVSDQRVSQKTFQANMERRVAMLLGEAMGLVRRVKRATTVGNSSVQVVSTSRLAGEDQALEVVYFVEGPSGERVPAVQTADLLNSLDVQRAAIVLGYRVQGILAQPVEKVASSPSENVNTNLWIIIGVVIPLLVVIVIISILYWKLCRTDKLEFQPDAMTSMQQRQKSTSISESRTSLLQPSDKEDVEFSEEEEWGSEEEEYEEEEEEENVKGGKKPFTHPKSKQQISSEEEEEDYDEEEEEEEEEFEEEEDEDEDKDEEIEKKSKSKTEEQKKQTMNVGKPKKTVESNKEEKPLPKERRAQKELQAPSVKGFDFAKLHLGQQSKDDVMVIQEPVPSGPGPLPMSVKDGLSPSENGEIPTPLSKGSSTKASHTSRRRERISPSDGDSVVTDHSSERESTEENLRGQGTPNDSKHTRKNRIGPPPMNGTTEQLSSASIFEHVDRMSRATDAGRRPNKVQLIAMQPMPVPPLHSPTANGKLSDPDQLNREVQVALRHKSEIEHHRNKIRLRAKRKGHYDFPAMDDMTNGLGDTKDQDRIYQKAQLQIDKILDPDAQMPAIFIEPKKSCRGRRSPKQRIRDPLNGGMMEADKDHLITDDSDAAYRKCPGVNNVAYVSDPDQGPGSPHRSPSPTDDVFLGPASSPPGHAPPPPPYMPPQPSIEEARQQMHSLLDDAFALVSPTSQGSTAGITLPGSNSNHSSSSPPGRSCRHWGSSYQPLGPFSTRFSDLSPPSVQGLTPRQGIGSSYPPPGESAGHSEQLQPDSLYSSRGLYTDEVPSSARPRPVGGTTGVQLQHLTQVGLSSRMNGYPAGGRTAPGQNGGISWNHYHENFSRAELEKDAYLDYHDYTSSVLQMSRSGIREPSALPPHLDTSVVGYLSAPPPLDTTPPTHSSASLIKAIREELLRLSQKQSAVSGYHS